MINQFFDSVSHFWKVIFFIVNSTNKNRWQSVESVTLTLQWHWLIHCQFTIIHAISRWQSPDMPDQNQWHFWLSVSPAHCRFRIRTETDSRHSVTRSQTSGGGLDQAYGYAPMPCPCIQYMCEYLRLQEGEGKGLIKKNTNVIVCVNKCNDF